MGRTRFGEDEMVRALRREGHEATAAVQQPLGQTHEKERLGVLGEELCLLPQGLCPTAVVGTGSNEANAKNGLERGDFVSVVSETRERFQHFGFGV